MQTNTALIQQCIPPFLSGIVCRSYVQHVPFRLSLDAQHPPHHRPTLRTSPLHAERHCISPAGCASLAFPRITAQPPLLPSYSPTPLLCVHHHVSPHCNYRYYIYLQHVLLRLPLDAQHTLHTVDVIRVCLTVPQQLVHKVAHPGAAVGWLVGQLVSQQLASNVVQLVHPHSSLSTK